MKNIYLKAMIISIAMVFTVCGFMACDEDDDSPSYRQCPSSDPYWCSSAKTCCGYQFFDGHGTCYNSMEYCRSSGYPCEMCHIQDR